MCVSNQELASLLHNRTSHVVVKGISDRTSKTSFVSVVFDFFISATGQNTPHLYIVISIRILVVSSQYRETPSSKGQRQSNITPSTGFLLALERLSDTRRTNDGWLLKEPALRHSCSYLYHYLPVSGFSSGM